MPHKFVPTLTALKVMDQKADQKGKFLTIYPNNEQQMKEIIRDIDNCLHEMVGLGCFANDRRAPQDKPVGAHLIITARYASHRASGVVLKKKEDIVGKVNEDNASCYLQERAYRDTKFKPDHICDPWNDASVGEDGWYDHPMVDAENKSRKGMIYDSNRRTWVRPNIQEKEGDVKPKKKAFGW